MRFILVCLGCNLCTELPRIVESRLNFVVIFHGVQSAE